MQNYIIIDLETCPDPNLIELKKSNIKAKSNLKDPEKIKADLEEKESGLHKELSLDTDYAEIVCIGIKTDKEEKTFMSIQEFADWYNPIHNITDRFVGFNLKAFDLPLLIKQGIKKGVKLPYRHFQSATKRFNVDCIDLMEIISYQSKFKSLEELSQIYFGKSKNPINFETATVDEIVRHNREDCRITYDLFKLFEPIL